MILMTHTRIQTIRELVDHWGGSEEVGKWLGIGRTAVLNWIAKDYIPPGYHLRIDRRARDEGIDIADEIFGLSAPEPNPPLESIGAVA